MTQILAYMQASVLRIRQDLSNCFRLESVRGFHRAKQPEMRKLSDIMKKLLFQIEFMSNLGESV